MAKALGVQVPSSARFGGEKVAQIKVSEVMSSPQKKEFRVVIPGEMIGKKVQAFLEEKREKVSIPGFRPGKAPDAILFQNYGQEAFRSALGDVLRDQVQHLIKEHTLSLAVSPDFDLENDDADQELLSKGEKDAIVRITFELSPDIPAIDLSTLSLIEYTPHISEEDVDNYLKEVAKSRKTSRPFDKERPAQMGDTLVYTLEYETKDGIFKTIEGAFVLGSGAFPPEFEKTLVGISKGHVIHERVRVPKQFPEQELSGKKISFKVAFSDIRETIPHEVNEELAKVLGHESLEKFREAAQKVILERAESVSRQLQAQQIFRQLDKAVDISVPKGLVIENGRKTWGAFLKEIGAERDMPEVRRQKIQERTGQTEDTMLGYHQAMAEQRAKMQLILADIARRNNIDVSEQELTGLLQHFVGQFPDRKEQVIEHLRENPAEIQDMRERFLESKIISWIKGQITDKKSKTVSVEQLADLVSNPENEDEDETASKDTDSKSSRNKSQKKDNKEKIEQK